MLSALVFTLPEVSTLIDQMRTIAHLIVTGFKRGDAVYERYINLVTKKSITAYKLDFAEVNCYYFRFTDTSYLR